MAEEETDTSATEADGTAQPTPVPTGSVLDPAQIGKVLVGAKGALANPDNRRFLVGALVGALVFYAGGTVFEGSDTGTSSAAETKVESLRADLAELRADLAVLQTGGGAAHEPADDAHPPTTPSGGSATDHGSEPSGDDHSGAESSDEGHGTTASHDDDPAAHTDEPPHWTYAQADNWGELADAYIECAEGSEQSPIDLSAEWDKVESTTELSYSAVSVSVVDNGHTIQVNAEGAGSVSQQHHEYELVQFHFHAPSEHTIDGEHHAAEVHLVHKDADGKLAVVGIMIDEGVALEGFDEILDAIGEPTVEHDAGEFDPDTLLPESHDFFHYRGSLTTPPCTEGVAWRVMAEPITISAAQLDELTSHFAEENNRPVQPRNGRDAHIDMA
jgi:carbonic anhydrase